MAANFVDDTFKRIFLKWKYYNFDQNFTKAGS